MRWIQIQVQEACMNSFYCRSQSLLNIAKHCLLRQHLWMVMIFWHSFLATARRSIPHFSVLPTFLPTFLPTYLLKKKIEKALMSITQPFFIEMDWNLAWWLSRWYRPNLNQKKNLKLRLAASIIYYVSQSVFPIYFGHFSSEWTEIWHDDSLDGIDRA